MTELENDALGNYYPRATGLMAQAPYNAKYLTYQEFLDFVDKYSGPDHLGYHGHYSQIYEPKEGICIGSVGILFHNSPIEQEYVVSFNDTAWAIKNREYARPQQTERDTDLNRAYAMYVAIAYPNLEMWEAFLNCEGNGDCQKTAIKKYQDMVPHTVGSTSFTEAEKEQFVKNLGG